MVSSFAAATWVMSDTYLYAVDLFNYGYWWECHEQWEAIWKFTGPDSHEGRFLQGLVQVSASCLRKFMGSHDSGAALANKGLLRLRDFEEDVFLGIDVAKFMRMVEIYFSHKASPAPKIDLIFPACAVEPPGAQ